MKKKDFENFINGLIEKLHPSLKGKLECDSKSIEDKAVYLETCISYILFDNECLNRESKAKKK